MGRRSNRAAQIQAGKEVLLEWSRVGRVSCRELRIVSIITESCCPFMHLPYIDFLSIVRDHPITVVYGILFFVPIK